MRIVKTLSKNADVKLYIATNQEHYRAAYLWNDLGFKDYFEDIYYSARLGCFKKDPAYFQQINAELNLKDQTVLFFDDSPDNIATASSCGWNAVLFNDVNNLIEHPLIKSLRI